MLTPPLRTPPPPFPPPPALAFGFVPLLLIGGAKAGRSVPTLGSLSAAAVPVADAARPPAPPAPAAPPAPLAAADLARKKAERLLIAWSKSEGVASRRRTQADSCERGPKPPLPPPLPPPALLPFPPPPLPPPKAKRSSARMIAP